MKDEEIRSMLGRCKTIAVVGISPKEDRPSYTVASYLKSKGYTIIPVRAGRRNDTWRKGLSQP